MVTVGSPSAGIPKELPLIVMSCHKTVTDCTFCPREVWNVKARTVPPLVPTYRVAPEVTKSMSVAAYVKTRVEQMCGMLEFKSHNAATWLSASNISMNAAM